MTKAKTKKWIAALIALFMVFSFVPQTKVFAESRIMNEVIIYDYLVGKMGFNCAAASGVLSNAYYESKFNPQEYGDRGTSYGLFQWHSGRMKNMMKYCDSNGYDYRTASGQMHYLEYELKRSYKTVLNHMLAVENTPEGAYDAGYYWCYYFEIPANKEAKSVQRGKTAKNTYWERYSEFGGKPLNSSNDFDMANYNKEFKRTLSPNNSGAADLDNLYIQLMLDKLGYKIDVDGVYGKNTAATVKRFQNDYGLDADGICDKNTWNAVKSASNGEIVPKCPLRIEEQPSDKTVYSGDKLTFVMKVVGTGLKYKWYTKKSGASNWTVWKEFTARTATATATDSWNGMQVRCVVTDRNGKKVESRTATVKLAVKPSITAHPQSVTAKTGDKLTFTVKAKGTGLRYQWYIKKPGTSSWSVWKEYTSSTATVKADDSWNGMQVRCVVTDVIGKKLESNAATVTLLIPLSITAHPQSVTVNSGDKVSFTVQATGTGLSYQWYYKKSGDSDWSEWKGYTSATATSTANDSWNGMKVRCVVKDSSGQKAESNTATVTLKNTLTITTQPQSVTAKAGDTVTFTVKATGIGLSYQWYVKKEGASDWTLWKGHTTAATSAIANDSWNGMKVRCVIKDSSGKKQESNAATVTLKKALTITAQPRSVTAKPGDTVTFAVKATGIGLSYQWYVKKAGASDWTLWKGHTTSTTSATANDSWNGMKVRCVIKDSSGKKVESNVATVTLL